MANLSDRDYTNRLAVALYETVIRESRGDADVAVVRTGSAFDALIMIAAVVVAGSPEFKTPQAIRKFCEDQAKKLRIEITACREDPDRAKWLGDEYAPDERH